MRIIQTIVYINISFKEKPDLETDSSMVCNDSSSINLSCTISTELSTYGFDMWEHSYRGISIRSLKGKEHDKGSILTIASCSFQDAGDYRCNGWTIINGETFSANKSVNLYINGKTFYLYRGYNTFLQFHSHCNISYVNHDHFMFHKIV